MTTATKNSMKIIKDYYTETMEEVTNWKEADMVIMTIYEVNEKEIDKALERLDKAVSRWCKTHDDAVAETPTKESNYDGTFLISVGITKQK